MTDIDRLYHKIKDHYHYRRCLMNAGAEELTFLVELLDEMERDDFGKDTNVPTKWISVKDGLPDEHKSVLCLPNGCPAVGEYMGYAGYHHVWQSYSRYGTHTHWDDDVEYWMPLPEPPEEDAHE